MFSRRQMLASLGALALAPTNSAFAFEFVPYDASVDRVIASGKPVVVHVYANWCLQCHAQANILEDLKGDKTYDGVKFFRVNYDSQKDVVAKYGCPRSTLIGFKGGKEVARMSWGMSEDAVVGVLKATL